MANSICTTCRTEKEKLFLKGERCLSVKCPMIRRPYPPGPKKKRRPSSLSEYGRELMEKQRLKNWYNLRETQFKNYVKSSLEKKWIENPADFLIRNLELRLDNAIFRLGFAVSRKHARQRVSHKYFLINGRPLNVASHSVKKGDVISFSASKAKKDSVQNLKTALKKHVTPSWLVLDIEKLEGRVEGFPTLQEAAPPADVPTIFEFYSR